MITNVDFNWDDVTSTGEVTKVTEKTEPSVEEPKEPVEELEEEDKSLWDSLGENEDESKEVKTVKDDEPVEPTEPVVDDTLKDFFQDLVESGIIETDDDFKEEELDVDKLYEITEKTVNKRVDEQINQLTQVIGEDGAKFLQYVRGGGKVDDFFKAYKNTSFDVDLVEADKLTDNNSKEIIEYYLKNIDKEEDILIEERIEFLEEKGTLRKSAEAYVNKLKKLKEQERNAVLEEQTKQQEIANKERQKYYNKIQKQLDESETIAGYSLTERQKKDLQKYVTSNSLVNDINKLAEDPEKLLALAALVKNNLSLEHLEKQVQTKQTKKLKERLSNRKTSQSSTSSFLSAIEDLYN